MHPTLEKFAYPDTVLRSYEHWTVVLRPAQVTIGSLVLAHNGLEERFADLPPAAFAELGVVVDHIEATLRERYALDKINYLMLMMVDPQVHFHVFPRYAGTRTVCGLTFEDTGWPRAPALGEACALEPEQLAAMVAHLRERWPT